MARGETFLKTIVKKICGLRLQHQLRRFYVSRRVIKYDEHREPEIAVLKFLVTKGDSVADVGANVGIYTKELSALVRANGRVYAFEPVTENYDILVTVMRKAHLTNVRPFHAALGAQAGRREIVIPALEGFAGYYWAHFAHANEEGRREVVDVLTLDDQWESHSIHRLDFIKCDVEGSELEVIQGAFKIIQAYHPAWLIEVSLPTSGEVFSLLNSIGYRAFVYAGRLIQTDSYRDKEFSNYFFLHPKSPIWDRYLRLSKL
ncbi:MAG TPA: FkbM family methyltransferase [Alphaproteobacteria bacterium]|nr:FkbM family methyltransferase [Alphaproteobacteria bacterium]